MTDPTPLSSAGTAPELHLGEPVTDATHAEFTLLLAATARATDDAFRRPSTSGSTTPAIISAGRGLDGSDGLGPRHCHAGEHKQVLAVAEAVRAKVAEAGELELGRRLVAELSGWFAHHVRSMDAMMVSHMRENGFSPSRRRPERCRPRCRGPRAEGTRAARLLFRPAARRAVDHHEMLAHRLDHFEYALEPGRDHAGVARPNSRALPASSRMRRRPLITWKNSSLPGGKAMRQAPGSQAQMPQSKSPDGAP